MSSYVYIRAEGEQLWTVGFYRPDGRWNPESDHPTPRDAAMRVRWLNGGADGEAGAALADLVEQLEGIGIPDWHGAEGLCMKRAKAAIARAGGAP